MPSSPSIRHRRRLSGCHFVSSVAWYAFIFCLCLLSFFSFSHSAFYVYRLAKDATQEPPSATAATQPEDTQPPVIDLSGSVDIGTGAGSNPSSSPKKSEQREKGKAAEKPTQLTTGAFSAATGEDVDDLETLTFSLDRIVLPEKAVAARQSAKNRRKIT
jgi:hypothetical protein